MPPVALKMDEYVPGTSGTYPIMILVHGGGWGKGCRYSMDGVGYSFATATDLSTHFITLSIDYRLACDPNDPVLQGTPVQPLCGWNYSTVDPVRNAVGAQIFDVEDAVTWVRDNWTAVSGEGSFWNHKIALVGGSAGGNLS